MEYYSDLTSLRRKLDSMIQSRLAHRFSADEDSCYRSLCERENELLSGVVRSRPRLGALIVLP